MTISDRVLDVLVDVSEIDGVRQEPDVRLYDLQILDSMKTVRLIVALFDRVRRRDLARRVRPRGVGDPSQDHRLHGAQGRRLSHPCTVLRRTLFFPNSGNKWRGSDV